MSEATKEQLALMTGGLLLALLGITIHYFEQHSIFGASIAWMGIVVVVLGSSQLISRAWITFRRPGEFERIPADVADRLIALGEDLDGYQRMVHSQGATFLRGFTESLEESADLFREWSPQLRSFAEECRTRLPCPLVTSLSISEQAKIEIYKTLIDKAAPSPHRRRNEVYICALPVNAMPVAKALWPGDDDRCVFLTPEEAGQWDEIYTHPEDKFWWFTRYWWIVETRPFEWSCIDSELDKVPDDCEAWLATSGVQWGPLAGGVVKELFSWDGNQAISCGNVLDCDF